MGMPLELPSDGGLFACLCSQKEKITSILVSLNIAIN
jgi:hypothetical protein